MVAMNSIPQQDNAKVNWHEPYLQHHLVVAKNLPTTPSGGSTIFNYSLFYILN
jgi:hypothetical protein